MSMNKAELLLHLQGIPDDAEIFINDTLDVSEGSDITEVIHQKLSNEVTLMFE